jgi:iron complex outermembrane receptor protein
VVGDNHVVVTPIRHAPASSPAVAPSVVASSLEAVTVTARGSGIPSLGGVVAGDVLDGRRLAEHDTRSLAQALDAMVPGMWVWEQSPSSLMARYGSIRGASSFGVTAPKVYIDGVAVANSLLLTRLDPQSIARVEIIRGPQGAALFGADAISGVINVVSRGGADSLSRGLQLRSETGLSSSTFASTPILSQRTELSARTGSNLRSAGIGLTFNALGEYVPGAASREFTASGDTRVVGTRGVLTGAARFLDTEVGSGPNPILALSGSLTDRFGGRVTNSSGVLQPISLANGRFESLAMPQKLRQYSANVTAVEAGLHTWTPSVTLGIDGYRLTNVAFARVPTPNASDSALRDARGGADRLTIRLNTARSSVQQSAWWPQ